MTNPQEQFFDFYRAGLRATGDLIRALEGAERLRKLQLAAAEQALAAHAQAVAELDRAKGEELAAVQGTIANAQYQAVIGYWSGICQAAGETQAEVAKRAQAHEEQIREDFQKALDAAPLTARATEDATKFPAAQLASANAGISQATEKARQKSA